MRTIDLTPLYRSTVGFDRMANMLDQVMAGENAAPSYPPYNIEKTGDDAYRITIAVAGFAEGELNAEVRDQVLTVTAKRAQKAD
ncbi:MAG: Hsp20 family protein, partial [Pseudomonadota bacterium]